jgi:PTS system nitrogen regulatory IIA component
MATNLSRIIPPENIVLDLVVEDKQQLFDKIALRLADQCGLPAATISQNLLEREKLASTGLGRGVAVPHGRIKGLKSPVAALVRLAEPMQFDSPDDKPVNLMIVLLIPAHVTQKHLEILSEVAEMFSDSNFRDGATNEKDPKAVHVMVVSWQPAYMKKT